MASGEWQRDGWIEVHNSFLHILYRTGIMGIPFIIFVNFFNMVRFYLQSRSWTGILLCVIIIQWFVLPNFMPIFELPYTAIPIWSLYGMALAYRQSKLKKETFEYACQNGVLSLAD